MRVLLVGSGGREHALAWGLARSPGLGELHAAPGNPGIAAIATCHPVAADDLESLTALAVSLAADLVVIGPEVPLVAGLADRLAVAGIATFGPLQPAARLEGSKAFAKHVMAAAGVPTAAYSICDTVAAAQLAIAESDGEVVIKADGLAAGKGVFVCDSVSEAEAAVRACLVDRRFGGAGGRVLIEQRLQGAEVSMLALCSGSDLLALAPARDYKRALDGDHGPNTGGMGCISPVPGMDSSQVAEIVDAVHRPVIAELARRGIEFRGCLYAGLMLTEEGPRVLEFNTRWGDPETQVIVPRLDGDLLDALLRVAVGGLDGASLSVADEACVTVVLAAAGYPDRPEKGAVISGVERAADHPGVTVFHAGTERDGERLRVAGGRVLNVSATGADLGEARRRAYQAAAEIGFDGMQVRSDIGEVSLV
ncbi:MAG: phosphoribosylamine---glycine ligase [Gaiellales bacterium]|jgi:phosphoribosylamine--glycine ligase|nr:phosphoribosylamine---glycine ligase [Gaiellales bacterium]